VTTPSSPPTHPPTIHICQRCRKLPGTVADRRTGTVDSAGNDWKRYGLALCEPCAAVLDTMPDAEAYADLTKR
jgi:hypothetical protein